MRSINIAPLLLAAILTFIFAVIAAALPQSIMQDIFVMGATGMFYRFVVLINAIPTSSRQLSSGSFPSHPLVTKIGGAS